MEQCEECIKLQEQVDDLETKVEELEVNLSTANDKIDKLDDIIENACYDKNQILKF